MDYKEKVIALLNSQELSNEQKEMLEQIFPELAEIKENDDKKIRLEIRNFIWGYPDKLPERDKWLAWFEKQKNTSDKEYVFRPVAGDTIEKAAEQAVELDGKVVLAFNGAYIPVGNKTKDEIVAEYYNWIKKQGEQKPKHRYTFNSIPRLLDMIEPTDRAKSYCQKLIDSLLQEGYAADAKIVSDCLKQMNGEKVVMATMDEHADKVEPKFKVGDWLVINNANIYQVVKIREGRYELYSQYGETLSVPTNFTYGLRLWTIQDAKDGDVLLEEETGEPFIYNGNRAIYFSGYFLGAYCGIYNGEFNPYGNIHYWGKNSCPATQEQRDLLFWKIHDAGYAWDSEKKEVKKIEL